MHGIRVRWYAATVESAKSPRAIGVHVRYLRARTKDDADQFAGLMLRWAWPCGHADHFDPILAEGMRRLPRPLRFDDSVGCGCTAGRCTLCN